MSLPVYVQSYSGYKANERPRQFVLDDESYDIAAAFDGSELLARPGIELVTIGPATVLKPFPFSINWSALDVWAKTKRCGFSACYRLITSTISPPLFSWPSDRDFLAAGVEDGLQFSVWEFPPLPWYSRSQEKPVLDSAAHHCCALLFWLGLCSAGLCLH